jgi:hypothetical protein
MDADSRAGAMVRQTRYLQVVRNGTVSMTNEFQKGALDKRIVMHLDAADIPDDLKHDSTDHADEESPGAVADTEVELAEEEKTE